MKKLLFTLCLLGLIIQTKAQEKTEKKSKVLYTVAYNMTSGHSNIPLIGFVNLSKGTQRGAEIGFVNTSIGKFEGGQLGFVNSAASDVVGGQVGFVNTIAGKLKGPQIGFVNTGASKTEGAQIGFVNTNAGTINGGQIGFVNTAVKNIHGGQVGFVNAARKKVSGSQIGFINYADEIEGGVPIGFLSFVRKGGYKAIEISTNEIFPVNLAFKTGVRSFYTYVKGGFNPNGNNQFGIGAGLGSQIRMSGSLFYNPEAETMSTISWGWDNHYVSFINSLRYEVGSNLELAAGPAITWRRNAYNEGDNGNLSWAYQYKINRRNDLIIGLRLSAAFTF